MRNSWKGIKNIVRGWIKGILKPAKVKKYKSKSRRDKCTARALSSSTWMSAYARLNSVRRIPSAVVCHSSSQPACSKYSSLWLGWRTKAQKVSNKCQIVLQILLTHGKAVDLRLVGRGVVFVEKAFANREGSLNRWLVFLVR